MYKGIPLVGPKNNKGVVLARYLSELGLHPSKVIFIDDSKKNIVNMEEVFKLGAIPNLNYRYGAADVWVASFDSKIADIEWKYFVDHPNVLLTDEEAMKPAPEPVLLQNCSWHAQ